jgi:hypothetical protein
MDTTSAQREIKYTISKLGWSQNRLAREIYVATFDFDDDDEINRLEERLKKELTRKTTKPERLLEYLSIIYRHNEFKNLDLIAPSYTEGTSLSPTLKAGMKAISEKLSKDIECADDL